MPWKSPLESDDTPGDASVTRELTSDEGDSRGSLSKRPRSISVCAVESCSIRSTAFSVTVIFVVAVPNIRVMSMLIGTVERTSTSWLKLEKPGAVTVRWYGLKGILEI